MGNVVEGLAVGRGEGGGFQGWGHAGGDHCAQVTSLDSVLTPPPLHLRATPRKWKELCV